MSSRKPDAASLPAELAAAWRASQASDAELRAAYLRYLNREPVRSRTPWFEVARWLLAGVALGGGAVYAATGAPRQLVERLSSPPAERASVPPPHGQMQPQRARSVAGALVTPARRAAGSERPVAPLANAAEKAAEAPTGHGLRGNSEADTQGWQRVARSLREHDLDAAQAALLALEAQGSQADRESAELVRAQLLLSQGRTSEALPMLAQLRASTQSASVRRKATELLSRHPDSAARALSGDDHGN
jgi:hypothetical protein